MVGRQEAVARFRAYLDYVIALDPKDPDNEPHDYEDNDNEEVQLVLSPHSTHSISIKPAFPHTDLNTVVTQFKATYFISALSTYIHRLIPPPALPVLPNLVDRFDIYKRITVLRPSNAAAGFPKSVDRLRATHSVPAKGRFKVVPAHFDTVLVRLADDDDNENRHTKGTQLEGMFSFFFFLASVITN